MENHNVSARHGCGLGEKESLPDVKFATVNPTLGPQLGDVGDSMHAIKNSPKVTSCSMNWSLQKHQKLTQSKYYMKVEKNL